MFLKCTLECYCLFTLQIGAGRKAEGDKPSVMKNIF